MNPRGNRLLAPVARAFPQEPQASESNAQEIRVRGALGGMFSFFGLCDWFAVSFDLNSDGAEKAQQLSPHRG
jgi:hypothetical protein